MRTEGNVTRTGLALITLISTAQQVEEALGVLPKKKVEHHMITHEPGISYPMLDSNAVGFNQAIDQCAINLARNLCDKCKEKLYGKSK